mmetsp:Transcript_26388/g.36330  ORF Transcript_26388/g.36330 Transcript_26388/m.36330 type:complete len:102 (-) Transcript_26388:788-1093(-)
MMVNIKRENRQQRNRESAEKSRLRKNAAIAELSACEKSYLDRISDVREENRSILGTLFPNCPLEDMTGMYPRSISELSKYPEFVTLKEKSFFEPTVFTLLF